MKIFPAKPTPDGKSTLHNYASAELPNHKEQLPYGTVFYFILILIQRLTKE
jgi:hypothetical protein